MPLLITLELVPRGDASRKRVIGTLEIENTGDHPQHPALANYRYWMTGPVHGGGTDFWHSGTLRDMERGRGYWAHVKAILNAVDCESQPTSELSDDDMRLRCGEMTAQTAVQSAASRSA